MLGNLQLIVKIYFSEAIFLNRFSLPPTPSPLCAVTGSTLRLITGRQGLIARLDTIVCPDTIGHGMAGAGWCTLRWDPNWGGECHRDILSTVARVSALQRGNSSSHMAQGLLLYSPWSCKPGS